MTDPRLAEADRAISLARGYEDHAHELLNEAMIERQRARRIRSEVSRGSNPRNPLPHGIHREGNRMVNEDGDTVALIGTATGRVSCSESNRSGPVLEPLPSEAIADLQRLADELTDLEDQWIPRDVKQTVNAWLQATEPAAEAIDESVSYVAVACEDYAGILTVLMPIDGTRPWEAAIEDVNALGYGKVLHHGCRLHRNVTLADDVATACPWKVTFYVPEDNHSWPGGVQWPSAADAIAYGERVTLGTECTYGIERTA